MRIVTKYCPNDVLVMKIDEDDINTFFINTDIDDAGEMKYLYEAFANSISELIPEYVAGIDYNEEMKSNPVGKMREWATAIMKLKYIDKLHTYFINDIQPQDWDEDVLAWYNKKGVFGEIILHYILKHFKHTIPLISKIYVKDSVSQEAHGFDAVHVTTDNNKNTLWLGESKFYTDGKEGISALIKDLGNHFKTNFLNEQFAIISRQLRNSNNSQRDIWLKELAHAKNLSDKFDLIKIPLFCIYEHKIAENFLYKINEIDDAIIAHSTEYKKYFDGNNNFKNKDKVQIVLILMPVKCKYDITKNLLEKIYHQQNI